MGLVFIRLNGCTAAFRTNGTTYNIDPQGVTATTDCLFWGAVDGAVADAWFPLPPGATSLPAPVAITTNANPRPANAMAIPNGFSFTSPNLSNLFASLPSGQAPVFPRTVTPGAVLRPYHETVTIAAGGGAGAIATALPWIRQPAMEVLAGGGAGAITELVKVVLAGSGSGVIASLSAETIPERLFAGSGSGVIADLSAATGGGGGTPYTFTGGTTMAWPSTTYMHGWTFTLSAAKTIKGVGFYDAGQNGLAISYSVLLAILNPDDPVITNLLRISFDAAGDIASFVVPSGTEASLDGIWRRVDLPSNVPGLELPTEYTYAVYAHPYYTSGSMPPGQDSVVKNVSALTLPPSMAYGINFAVRNRPSFPVTETISADGTAYFGPMIFFE
jgi:hypothetical protein